MEEKPKMKLKKFFAFLLAFCLLFSAASAEQVDIFSSIGNWFGQAVKDAGKWVSQAWEDSTKWVNQALDDSGKWVAQAWEDSSKWVSQAWTDSSKWVADNWTGFLTWVKTITWDNPYTWIPTVVQEKGAAAYDEYAAFKAFLAGGPDAAAVRGEFAKRLAALSLAQEEQDSVWNVLAKWAEDKKIPQEKAALLAIPCLVRLNLLGKSVLGLGDNDRLTAPMVAQYQLTILEAMQVNSAEDAEARLNALRSTLDQLAKPAA